MIDFLNLTDQYESIRDNFLIELDAALRTNNFILGSKVEAFERRFSEYFNVSHCLGVSNGADALTLALEALKVGPGDEVILNANTFSSVAMAVCRVGAVPVFCDIEPQTLQLDVNQIEALINNKTKCIIAGHLFGAACDIEKILGLCAKYHLHLIEDCSHAHGLKINGKSVGTFGDIGVFSFHPVKNLGAMGDAGLVCTQSSELYDSMCIQRNNGKISESDHQWGYNHRMDAVQAIFLSLKIQSGVFRKEVETRKKLAKIYFEQLRGFVTLPQSQGEHVFHVFCILLKSAAERSIVIENLKRNSIGFKIHYPTAIYNMTWYKNRFPKTEKYKDYLSQKMQDRILSIPLHASLTEEQVWNVCKSVKEVMV